ncbi:MAG: hypothetical protein ACI4D4_10450 [Lachnospira sp.]
MPREEGKRSECRERAGHREPKSMSHAPRRREIERIPAESGA